MKTAIQEIIDSFETFKGMCKTDGEKFIINYAISNSKLRLEKEKQQIIEAQENGHSYYEKNGIDGEEYYNLTFGDKETQAE